MSRFLTKDNNFLYKYIISFLYENMLMIAMMMKYELTYPWFDKTIESSFQFLFIRFQENSEKGRPNKMGVDRAGACCFADKPWNWRVSLYQTDMTRLLSSLRKTNVCITRKEIWKFWRVCTAKSLNSIEYLASEVFLASFELAEHFA